MGGGGIVAEEAGPEVYFIAIKVGARFGKPLRLVVVILEGKE